MFRSVVIETSAVTIMAAGIKMRFVSGAMPQIPVVPIPASPAIDLFPDAEKEAQLNFPGEVLKNPV